MANDPYYSARNIGAVIAQAKLLDKATIAVPVQTIQPRRLRVQRMATSASREIQEWNARVEARNRAKGKKA